MRILSVYSTNVQVEIFAEYESVFAISGLWEIIIGAGKVEGELIWSMPELPEVESATEYYKQSMMTGFMQWFCRTGGKKKFSESDIEAKKEIAKFKAGDRNPYSWNMEFYEYEDGSGYEARFTTCGICTLNWDWLSWYLQCAALTIQWVKQIVSVILPRNIQSLRVDRIATAVIRKEVQNKML